LLLSYFKCSLSLIINNIPFIISLIISLLLLKSDAGKTSINYERLDFFLMLFKLKICTVVFFVLATATTCFWAGFVKHREYFKICKNLCSESLMKKCKSGDSQPLSEECKEGWKFLFRLDSRIIIRKMRLQGVHQF